jgi:hypothetical protein|nr:MAG TPA: hypothetical protein [Caudoviricetes sp.]
MKYTIEFRDGLRFIEKEIEGMIPNKGDSVKLNDTLYKVDEVITDLSYSEPIYKVKLRLYFED